MELSLDLTSGFDWTQESVSPDFLPSIFRPKRESLVDIEFDHSRAAEGRSSSANGHLNLLFSSTNAIIMGVSQLHSPVLDITAALAIFCTKFQDD